MYNQQIIGDFSPKNSEMKISHKSYLTLFVSDLFHSLFISYFLISDNVQLKNLSSCLSSFSTSYDFFTFPFVGLFVYLSSGTQSLLFFSTTDCIFFSFLTVVIDVVLYFSLSLSFLFFLLHLSLSIWLCLSLSYITFVHACKQCCVSLLTLLSIAFVICVCYY